MSNKGDQIQRYPLPFSSNIRASDMYRNMKFGEKVSTEAAEQYLRSVTVAIFGSPSRGPSDSEKGERKLLGSGFFFDTNMHLLTCAHVINGYEDLTIVFAADPDKSWRVTVESADNEVDLALLSISPSEVGGMKNHSLDFIHTVHEMRMGQVTFCAGFPCFAAQQETNPLFQISRGSFTLIPTVHSFVVSNITDYGCSGGHIYT